MSRKALSEWSDEELLARYLAILLEQDEAISRDQSRKYNRLFEEMLRVAEELKARPANPRQSLLPLLNHRNAQVRLMSAIDTLAIDRDRALAALQAISDRNEYPQAADARGIMRSLSEGRYQPS
jgi:molybdopterin-guanine dinucleotide biosynthesis protein A